MRGARDVEEPSQVAALQQASRTLAGSIERAKAVQDVDVLRGLEGEAAGVYFGVFDSLITAGKSDFCFKGRNRRPPLDPVNALLSFLYTLLAHDTTSAVAGVGLDSAVGFLHTDRPGRPSLALDIMEEFRAMLADRVALSLINRRQVRADGFEKTASGAVEMDAATRKEVLSAWQKRKQEEMVHPFLEERIPVGLAVHVQAMLLARYLRGDIDAYPAVIWRG